MYNNNDLIKIRSPKEPCVEPGDIQCIFYWVIDAFHANKIILL